MFANTIICFAVFGVVKSARILVVVPTPSISHQIVFRPLIQELTKADHEVVEITTDPIYSQGKSGKNLKEIDVHDLSYSLWNKVYNKLGNTVKGDASSKLEFAFRILHEVFREQLKHESIQKLLTDNTIKFDLIIMEEVITPALIYSYIFTAPVILMSSFGESRSSLNAIGAVTQPILYPKQYHRQIYNLTIWQKFIELYHAITLEKVLENLEFEDDRILKSLFGVDTPSLNELKSNVHMLFLNANPIWLHSQPVPLNVVYNWDIHKTPEKLLPEDLQAYLDSSKNGVIYMSLGTNFRTTLMHPETLQTLLKVFSKLPYNILWKWDMDELPGKSENIKISKWLPQCDILRHPKIKLFITQGGLQSTQEAIHAGVPVIGIPIFSDQEYNTEKYLHFKIGVKLKLQSLTIEKFENAINTILNDYDSYRKNVIELRTRMQDQPVDTLKNVIWWIEYVLRHKGVQHLRSPAANMSWAEYYEVELVCVVLTQLIVLGAVLLFSLNYLFKFFI